MKNKLLVISIMILYIWNIVSCATGITEVENNIIKTQKQIEKTTPIKPIEHDQNIYNTNKIYVSSTITSSIYSNLPQKFKDKIQVNLNVSSFKQLADAINKISGITVLLDVDEESKPSNNIYISQINGTLYDLLNNIQASADIAWHYQNGCIVLSDTLTQTFFIQALPGAVSVQNQVNSNSGITATSGGSASIGDGSGSSTSQSFSNNSQNSVQNVQFTLSTSIWEGLSGSIRTMLSKKGQINVMPATSSLTVTDKPSVLLKVSQFITQQNEALKKQVQIDVQVLSLET